MKLIKHDIIKDGVKNMTKIIINDKEYVIGETVWVSPNFGETFHTGVILGVEESRETGRITFKLYINDENTKNVKYPTKKPFNDYFSEIYKEEESDKIQELKKMGWTVKDIRRGYIEYLCEGTDYVIPEAIIIERIDEVEKFESDWDACRQAEKDGVLFINDIDGLEKGLYIDTKKNREVCKEYLKENPQYLVKNLMKDETMQEYWDNYKKYFNL